MFDTKVLLANGFVEVMDSDNSNKNYISSYYKMYVNDMYLIIDVFKSIRGGKLLILNLFDSNVKIFEFRCKSFDIVAMEKLICSYRRGGNE